MPESHKPPAQGECFHCGLPVPPGAHYSVVIDDQPRAMCCPGCQAVAQAIVDGGMSDYYRYRTEAAPQAHELVPRELEGLRLYDREALQRSFVTADGDRREAALILEGITCAACVWLNEKHVRALPGVLAFHINYATKRARVQWDASRVQLSDILHAIAAIGYQAHPFDAGRQEAAFKRERSQALRRVGVAGLGMMQVMMMAIALYSGDFHGMDEGLRSFLRWASLILTLPVMFYSSLGFFTSAWRDLRQKRLGMDLPVSITLGAHLRRQRLGDGDKQRRGLFRHRHHVRLPAPRRALSGNDRPAQGGRGGRGAGQVVAQCRGAHRGGWG